MDYHNNKNMENTHAFVREHKVLDDTSLSTQRAISLFATHAHRHMQFAIDTKNEYRGFSLQENVNVVETFLMSANLLLHSKIWVWHCLSYLCIGIPGNGYLLI